MKLTHLIKRQVRAPVPSNDGPYEWIVQLGRRAAPVDAAGMSASEQMFFFDAPLAHVVLYQAEMSATRRAPNCATGPLLARLR